MTFDFSNFFGITVNFPCGVAFDEKAKIYQSYCPELDLRSQGLSEIEAKESIRSAIGLYLSCAREINLVLAKPVRVNLYEKNGSWYASGDDIAFSIQAGTEEDAKREFKVQFVEMIKSQTERAYGPFQRISELNPKFKFRKSLSVGSN